MAFTSLVGLNEGQIQRITWTTTGNGDIMNSSWGWSTSSGNWLVSESEKTKEQYQRELNDTSPAYYRPHIELRGNAAFTILVNWGDGSVETYNSCRVGTSYWRPTEGRYNTPADSGTNGTHLVMFTPQVDSPYAYCGRNPADLAYQLNGAWVSCWATYWDLGNQDFYSGIQHQYANETQTYNVVVNVTTSSEDCYIRSFYVYSTYNMNWETIELPYLTTCAYQNTYKQQTFPYSNFVYLDNIVNLQFSSAVHSSNLLRYFPDTLFQLDTLLTLWLMSCINTESETWWDDYNLDRIALLTNVSTLRLSGNEMHHFPKVLSLKAYDYLSYGTDTENDLDYSAVDSWDYTVLYLCEAVSENYTDHQNTSGNPWLETLTKDSEDRGIDLSNILRYTPTGYDAYARSYYNETYFTQLPESYDRLWGIVAFWYSSLISQWNQNICDAAVKCVYSRTCLSPMEGTVDGHRNQWYYISNNLANNYNSTYTPTGTYQAPTGFVQGESNGEPESPMEMIYVMQHNYAQTWTVVGGISETYATLSTRSSESEPEYASIIYDEAQYQLSKNAEGNYIFTKPGTTTLGIMQGSTQKFDDIYELRSYVEDNNLNLINRDHLDETIELLERENGQSE